MRTEQEMMDSILNVARADERIRFLVRKGFTKITMVEAKTNYSTGVYGGIELEKSLERTT